MICSEVIKGEKGFLCAKDSTIYACEKCEGRDCENCIEIPRPTIQQELKSGEYGSFDTQTIKNFVLDKKFLFGLGAGLLLGMLLFKKS